MTSLYACITEQHEPYLVLLAALVCFLGVYTSFLLADYVRASPRRADMYLWGGSAVFCLASSTWATHFIAMLAFRPGAPAGFDPALTIASFVIAVAVIGLGLSALAIARGLAGRLASGAAVGIGISAMHYVGMAAYQVPGRAIWDGGTIATSVLGSVLFAGGSVAAGYSRWRAVRNAAPLAMLLAICSLHFVGMDAVSFAYDPAQDLPAGAVSPNLLSVVVACVALLILALSVVALALTKAGQRRFRRERERFSNLADVALEGLLICHGEQIVSANLSVAALCDCDSAALVGLPLADVLKGVSASSVSETAEEEAHLCFGHRTAIPVRILRREIEVGHRRHQVVAVRDQRERLRTEAHIRSLAFSDPLTGLPNRARFGDELEAQLASRRKKDGLFSLMMIDLDRFKIVNDTLGHAVGDVVLQRAARRLRAAVREEDIVARLGGDEFALLQVGTGGPDVARAVAARIIDLMGRPFIVDGHVINIGASVGVALAPADGDTPELLLRNADLAAYNAKQAGRGTFRLFEAGLDARMHERRRMEQDLRRAVACREFEVFYQPQIDAKSGQVSGAEALVRWRDPVKGLISPADFIPLAEETGLIANIGEWVLRTACAEATTWPAHMSLAVNISPVQFRDARLADMITDALAATGLAPERLELEITEGSLMTDEVRSLATLNELRRSGIRISMDDFGTGYSSLSYLRRFPFDKIKVDQSFVRQIPDDNESATIVRAILTMASCLGLTTTVEGVETAEQLAFTSAEGCDQVQGFLLSRPIDAATLTQFITERRAA